MRYPDDGLDDEDDDRPLDEGGDFAESGCIDPAMCCCPHPFHDRSECCFPEDYEGEDDTEPAPGTPPRGER